MKPLLHSSSFHFFSFTLLMILIINIGTCLCQDDDKYMNCNTAFKCGNNIPDLKYPFWGGDDRKEYCGGVNDPNTKLTCEGSVLKITINDVNYRIHDWDDKTQKLTVIRDDYSSGDVCALTDDSKNSTYDNTQFQQYGDVANVTLLYGCSVAIGSLPNVFGSINCNRGDIQSVVYTVTYPVSYSAFCTPTVTIVIPISGAQAAQLVSGNGIINNSLKDGFDLKWNGNYGECEGCVVSGGACGNDGGSKFRCFCENGTHTTSCTSPMASSMSIISLSPTLILFSLITLVFNGFK